MSDLKPTRLPTVFISSTVEDLKTYRAAVDAAVRKNSFHVEMCEYFASAPNPPLRECLDRVAGRNGHPTIDVLVVVVAERYGWVPKDQNSPKNKSITWLECQEAEKSDIDILPFLLDSSAEWDARREERYRLMEASREKCLTPALAEEVERNCEQLEAFKKWLDKKSTRTTFKSPEDLAILVVSALNEWRSRRPRFNRVQIPGDPTRYLGALLKETASIEIRGLAGDATAKSFPIEDLYIRLRSTTAARAAEAEKGKGEAEAELRGEKLDLDEALKQPRLAIVGDPGAGKTTFLRRIAQLSCRAALESDGDAVRPLGFEKPLFPILVRLWELQQHIAAHRGTKEGRSLADDPQWLPHFLAAQWGGSDSRLDADFWVAKLSGGALLLLDGLDEAPSDQERKLLRRLIEKTAGRWPETRVAVTSRPAAYAGEAVLSGFSQAWIDALDQEAIQTFLQRWTERLYPGNPARIESYRKEIARSLAVSPIRRLARNPVMLTALAVIHWNETRLPEQRAELYESVLLWLARSRQDLPRRPSPDRALSLLQALALSMQSAAEGRQIQIPRREAAEYLAPLLDEDTEQERIQAAERFLVQEENDSGIVAGRGKEIRFWHLTFQEYLAARALAGLPDKEQHKRVLDWFYQTEWREVVLLLFGVLHGQGVKKVDAFFKAVLNGLGDKSGLADEARCAGMLGSILRDLTPLHYVPRDRRYQRLMKRALAIFDKEESLKVPIEVAIEAAEALGQAGDPRFGPDRLDDNRVEIPAGEFWMGAQNTDPKGRNYDPKADDQDGPPHLVRLDAYRIGRYPVTVAEYAGFMEDEGYAHSEFWNAGGFGDFGQPGDWESQREHRTCPVVGVSWFEAAAYAAWAGARLPSEAQWERAARGLDARLYPWGDEDAGERRLNCRGEDRHNVERPSPVGVYPLGATPEGICDLAGNADEWCADWLGPFDAKEQRNPTGPEKGAYRSLRGGAWYDSAGFCRSSVRDGDQPGGRDGGIGFRVVFLGSQD